MTLEEFDELNKETKNKLMLHWWHYYGKMIYSLEDLEEFMALLESDFNKVLDFAIISYSKNEGPTLLLKLIMKKQVGLALKVLPDFHKLPNEEYVKYLNVKQAFIDEIIRTSGIEFPKSRT